MEPEKLRQRINELSAKRKEGGLTDGEELERVALREEFLANFRKSFRSQVEMMQVFDDNGKEVTPEKVRDIQRKKGLRDD